MSVDQALTQERRPIHFDTKYEYEGQSLTIREWSKTKNIRYDVLKKRLIEHNWSIEKALTQPIRNEDK